MLFAPLEPLARLPRPVQWLLLGTLVNRLGTFIFPYLTLILRREFGLDAAAAAGLVAAFGAGSIASLLTGGWLSDRLGRRHTLALSTLGAGLLAVLLGVSPGIAWFAPLLALYAFVADLYRPAVQAVVGDLLPPGERAVGFAALRQVANLGFACGLLAGGFLADLSWRWLFIGDGLTSAVFGAVVLLRIAETRPQAPGGTSGEGADDARPLRDPVFRQAALASLLGSLVYLSHATAFPLTVAAAGYPARAYGMLIALNGLLIALFEVSVVVPLRRFRRLRVAALGLVLTALGFGLVGFVPHWAWLALTVVLWTAGEILSVPQQVSFLADWAPPRARGRYFGAHQATWSLAILLNPLLFLPLQARLDPALFWLVAASPALAGAGLLLVLDRTADRPEILAGRAPTSDA